MSFTNPQTFSYATPPALGTGAGYSLKKNPKFNLLVVDKYGLNVVSRDQYSNQNSLHYDIDVFYSNGTIAPSGFNFETGLKGPNYTFTYDKNYAAFTGNPQREYSLVFKLSEDSPSSTSSGKYSVYHNPAQLSGVSGVVDGSDQGGGLRYKTGSIDINVSMTGQAYYSTAKFEIYSGDVSNFQIITGTGGNLLKTVSVFDQKQNYTLTINDGEQPANEQFYFYKILPYDDFGSGILYSSPPISGQMYAVATPAFTVDALTGKSVVLLNDGAYTIQTFHSGNNIGTGYTLIDSVANISGNIISGGWYNYQAVGDFTQNDTYPFKTIKYLAQISDATGNVSSREILITDNSTSVTGATKTGIRYSEYAVSDNNETAAVLVSGSGYSNGSGYICLFAKVNYESGSYKLLRTIL